MAKELKREAEVMAADWNRIPKDRIAKDFIISLFREMSLEDLKNLVAYKVLDPEDRAIWQQEPRLYAELVQLSEERKIKLQASIRIEY